MLPSAFLTDLAVSTKIYGGTAFFCLPPNLMMLHCADVKLDATNQQTGLMNHKHNKKNGIMIESHYILGIWQTLLMEANYK